MASKVLPKQRLDAEVQGSFLQEGDKLAQKVARVRDKLADGASGVETPNSPHKGTPRTIVAEQLKAMSVRSPRKLFADGATRSSSAQGSAVERALASLLTVAAKPLHDTNKKALETLMSKGELQFFRVASATRKQFGIAEDLRFEDFKPVFSALKAVLLAVEDRDFLDEYIIDANTASVMEDKFLDFHAKITTLKEALEKIGICGLKEGQTVNFWSGKEGQARAASDEDSFSDSDIPLFKFLFGCWGHIKNHETMQSQPTSFFTGLLPTLFSAIFASHAKGVVNVYM